MILGTKARYAVMAMVELAGQEAGKPTSLADLAEAQEITVPYLEQIFRHLRQAGLVTAVHGPGGGYALARAAGDIPISDIIEASEESLQMTRCDKHEGRGCMASKARCMTHNLWDGLEKNIHNYLHAISLADVRQRKI